MPSHPPLVDERDLDVIVGTGSVGGNEYAVSGNMFRRNFNGELSRQRQTREVSRSRNVQVAAVDQIGAEKLRALQTNCTIELEWTCCGIACVRRRGDVGVSEIKTERARQRIGLQHGNDFAVEVCRGRESPQSNLLAVRSGPVPLDRGVGSVVRVERQIAGTEHEGSNSLID